MRSHLTHLECSNCGATSSADQLRTVCPVCGKVLFCRYDLAGAATEMTPSALASRPWDLWRYFEILPVRDPANALTLGEGGTPLLRAPALGRAIGLDRLLVKDEGMNPTGSFKARGLGMAVSRAKELGATSVAIPSAGNAGSAMAAYAARAAIPAWVFMPADAPVVMKAECVEYGARVFLVDGLINDAGRVVREAGPAHGWFDVSTLKEPYRAEGKKTMGLELAEQLGWRLPAAIVYPTGGGTGIVGMWKAFAELETMGLIGPERPKMIVVQAEGCAPIVRAFDAGERHAEPWRDASTGAPGLRVPVAIGDYLILDAVRQSGGTALTVTEAELMEGVRLAATHEGMFVSPEAGATFVATRTLRESGFLRQDDEVVIFSTGSGMKHTDLTDVGQLPVLDPNAPDLASTIAATPA
ncbi:MAG: Threonine synthase [uncultured Thermomicrobiales bacterium]|uniref:Threonine synthase n=1 Tax=uncultured Thermomicrobiales bacterium TaxID=1645740 RepID=A0A6J4VFK3_9BACT|nr:MAG: Threonine synthase [uncultured Thermomicrobiales bacterium]